MKNKGWLKEIALKRRSQTSSVIVVESSDPERFTELFKRIGKLYKRIFNKDIQKLLIYDPFQGLVDKEGVPIKPSSQSSLMSQTSQRIRNLTSACDLIDQHAQTATTVALIRGISTQKEELQHALRHWAVADKIYEQNSTIIVFAPDVNTILDNYTKDLVAVVAVNLSSTEERAAILKRSIEALELKANGDITIATAGLNLHQTESALLESAYRTGKFDAGAIAQFKSDIVRKSGILEIQDVARGFEAVGGYQLVKDFITQNVINVLKRAKEAEKFGIRAPRGILFFGPPGTGKTLLAKCIAREVNLTFCNLRTENIFTKYVGESERKMKSAIQLIEEISPSVVMIDEVDRFGRRASTDGDGGTTRRVFSQMLEYLGDENRKAIVLMTTNEITHLDAAFLRTGRIDYRIPVLFPNKDARLQILKVHSSIVRKVPFTKNIDLETVANQTNLWSGAELEELVIRAARHAFNRDAKNVTQDDLNEALAGFRIDLQLRQKQLQRYLDEAQTYCDDAKFLEKLQAASTGDVDRIARASAEFER